MSQKLHLFVWLSDFVSQNDQARMIWVCKLCYRTSLLGAFWLDYTNMKLWQEIGRGKRQKVFCLFQLYSASFTLDSDRTETYLSISRPFYNATLSLRSSGNHVVGVLHRDSEPSYC